MSVEGLVGQISVEIEGLKGAAADLRRVLESGYRVQVPKIYDSMQAGAQVGGQLVRDEWAGLQDSYDTCLQATADALRNIDLGTQAMAAAADAIAVRYGSADGFARVQAADVAAVLPTPPRAELDENEKVGGYVL